MDQTNTGTEDDDHCITETEDDTLAQRKKRAKRVSFVERDVTSIRIFEPDEDSATPPKQLPNLIDDADKPVISYIRDRTDKQAANDVDSGDEGEDENPGNVFFRPLESVSPASSIISSATSNDEHFFGPVSTSFIKHGRVSDSSTYDEHEMTMDSTAFSMHYRSLMNSNSLDLKTPLTTTPTSSSAKSLSQISNGHSNFLDFSTPSGRVSLVSGKGRTPLSSQKELLPVSGEAKREEISQGLSNAMVPNSSFSNSPQNVISTGNEDIKINELTDHAIISQVYNEISQSDYILMPQEHCEPKEKPVDVNDELADETVEDNNLIESFSSEPTTHNCNGLGVILSTPKSKNSEYLDHTRIPFEHLGTHETLEKKLNDIVNSVNIERRSRPYLKEPGFSSSVKKENLSYATPSTQNLDGNELFKSREQRGSSFKRNISWMDACAPSPLGSLLKDGIERSKQKVSQLRMLGRTPINGVKKGIGPECFTENTLSVAFNLDLSQLEETLFDINHGSDEKIIPKFSESGTESQRVRHLAKEVHCQSSPAFNNASRSGNSTLNNLILGSADAELGVQNDASKVHDFLYSTYNIPPMGSKYPQHYNSKEISESGGASLTREDSVSKLFLAASDLVNQLKSVDCDEKRNIDSISKGNVKNERPCDDDVERDRQNRKTEGCFTASTSVTDKELQSTPWEPMLSKISSCYEALLPSIAKTLHRKSISFLIDRITEQQNIKKYTSLCFHLQSLQEKHKNKPVPKNYQNKVSEMQTLLYKLVYEKAKVELLNLKVDICSKVCERIRTSAINSRELKSLLHQSLHENDGKLSSNEASKPVDSVCIADEMIKLEFGATEMIRKLMERAQSYGMTISKEPRCSEINAMLADKLNKKIVSQVLRGSLQLWTLEKFSSGFSKYDILLSYRGFFLQRYTIISRSQIDSVHVSIEIIEKHIAKYFPCTNAVLAFSFVLKPLMEQFTSFDRMRHVAQDVSFLLQNLLEVMEEIQSSLLKCTSLVQALFVLNEEQLVLELGFVDVKCGAKVNVSLDLTCLKCGAYPSEALPFKIDTNHDSFSVDAPSNVPAGHSKIFRISTCVSSLLALPF